MIEKILLPMLGETMDEATIAEWHMKEGAVVKRGDVVLEITTDKATLEVQAYAAGTIRKILAPEGMLVAVNEPIAILADPGENVPEELLTYTPKSAAELKPEAAKAAPVPAREGGAPAEPTAPSPLTGERAGVRGVGTPPSPWPFPQGGEGNGAPAAPPPYQVPFAPMEGARLPVTPRAKRVAKERDLGFRFLTGSGPGGRLRERDIVAYEDEVAKLDVTPAAKRLAAQRQVDLRDIKGTGPGERIVEDDVAREEPSLPAGGFVRRELSAMRSTIAHRMAWSAQNVPQFSLTVAVDMTAAGVLRRKLEDEGTKVSLTGLIAKATATALRERPEVAALFDRGTIIRRAGIHVGIAVALDDGLIVPVVRNADRLSLVELSAAAKDLIERSRSNRLTPDEYAGGVITVSNLGMLGVDEFQAIVNPGESAILACGRIVETPVAADGAVAVRPVLRITGSFDHRAVDGAQGARFLARVKELLEAPEELA